MPIAELIREKIEAESRERQIRVLLACESGSRAWGFASPDSDYDVRLVYSHSPDWFMSLQETRDTIEVMDDVTTIDLAGWELRKALRLFLGCNPTMNEWLLSPIVYRQEDAFVERLRELMPSYFNPRKAVHHYLGTARQIMRHHLDGDRIGIKKAFYVIRPIAAAAWIRDLGAQPPTDFARLLEGTPSPEIQAIRPHVEQLIAIKAKAAEKEPIRLPQPLSELFHDVFHALEESAQSMPATTSVDPAPLQSLLRNFLNA
ncbi:hypothetical protein GC173_19010 [bacterium]|nr:hypothetical protein [bacterium]